MLMKAYDAEGWIGRNELSLEALYYASQVRIVEPDDKDRTSSDVSPDNFVYGDIEDAGPDPRRVRVRLTICVQEIPD